MTRERLSWLLAMFLCVILSIALGYWDTAIAGIGGLGVLWWLIYQHKMDTD